MKIFKKQEIIRQLQEMGAPQDSIVTIHSSMRAVGAVEGGAEGFLDILIEYFTEKGGLFCVPTHTWHRLKEEITMEMDSKDCITGALSCISVGKRGGIRSENPTHSMVVFGDEKRAREFIKDEPFLDSGTAPNGCYGKLYAQNGWVLLIGVAHNRNTYLHAAEEILEIPNRITDEPRQVAIRLESGEIIHRQQKTHHTDFTKDVSARFPKYETAFRYHRCITDGFLGNAPTQLCSARKMKETMELIFKNSEGQDPLMDERPILQKWYCPKEN